MDEKYCLKREDIRIRDPFVLTDTEKRRYYMYGTTALHDGSIYAGNTFSVYESKDLKNFTMPKTVVSPPDSFWGKRDFWAPEVHRLNGRYYLFGSCIADGYCRGTHVFACDTPDGDFVPLSDEPITPVHWECLDATLYIEDGIPYTVFCREWLEVDDGEMWAMPLKDDLTAPAGKPFFLFCASDNPLVTELHADSGAYVTDGPFLFNKDGKLRLLWSSFGSGRYMVLEAESDGGIRGRWTHHGSRFAVDGGHAMLFKRLDGTQMIALHSPNYTDMERAVFLEYK